VTDPTNAPQGANNDPRPVTLATFPLHEITQDAEGRAACGCGNPVCPTVGKHPAYPYSELEPGEQLGAGPGGGYGIATGARSGIFVVDLDVRPAEGKDGVAAFTALGSTPRTTIVSTPTGGLHLYFRLPHGADGVPMKVKTSGGELGPGIDVRGEGGFVVGPGSPHRNGGVYEVLEEAPIADAPGWLLGLLTKAHDVTAASTRRAVDPASPEGARRVAFARDLMAKMPPSVDGAGGSKALLRACIRLVCLELPPATCADLVRDVFNPRCTPPWSDAEIRHKVADADRSEKTLYRGFPSEGWLERLCATPVFEARELSSEPEPNAALNEFNPAHRPTFTPGDEPHAADPKVISFTRAQADLWKHAEWTGVLGFDELRGHVVARNPPVTMDAETSAGLSDNDVEGVRSWFEAHGHLITSDNVRKAIDLIARRRKFHPIRQYLASLPPATAADHAALEAFASKALGNEDAAAAEMVRKTVVAAVRRVLSPGVKVDSVLVLAGPQGAGKSRLIETLFGEAYTKSQLPDIATKDASAELRTAWVVELAELASVRKSDRETLKSFLSRRIDTYRPPYGRSEITSPRSSIFIGTTNAATFLEDASGGRRFWPLSVSGEIDLEWVRANRDGLLAAAYALAQDSSYPHWFNDAAGELDEVREAFNEEDAWFQAIKDYCTGRLYVRRDDVYRDAVARGDVGALAKATKREMDRIVEVLQRLGCTNVRMPRGNDGKRDHGWKVPQGLATETPTDEETTRRAANATAARARKLAS
jgi:hypothetical protein